MGEKYDSRNCFLVLAWVFKKFLVCNFYTRQYLEWRNGAESKEEREREKKIGLICGEQKCRKMSYSYRRLYQAPLFSVLNRNFWLVSTGSKKSGSFKTVTRPGDVWTCAYCILRLLYLHFTHKLNTLLGKSIHLHIQLQLIIRQNGVSWQGCCFGYFNCWPPRVFIHKRDTFLQVKMPYWWEKIARLV